MAEKELFAAFMKNSKIFVELPEGTSINRATAFNKTAVARFFNNIRLLEIDTATSITSRKLTYQRLRGSHRFRKNLVSQKRYYGLGIKGELTQL